MTVVFAVHALADARARAAPRRGARRGAVRGRGGRWCREIPGRARVVGRGRRARRCCSGTSPARSAATGSSTSRARASSSSSATCTCASVNEFADGGLHPGYAFPLWQAFLALIAKVAFVDPSKVVLHEASVLARSPCWPSTRRAYGAVPAGRARCRVGRRGGRDRGDGGRARRLVHLARAARDVVAPAPRPGGARARVHGRARPDEGARSRASAPPRSCSPSSTRPTRSSSGSRSPASSPCAGRGGARRSAAARSRSPRSSCRRRCSSPGSCPSSARRRRSAPTRTSARAASSTTPASSTARPTSSGSRRRCSAARARSPSPRCC